MMRTELRAVLLGAVLLGVALVVATAGCAPLPRSGPSLAVDASHGSSEEEPPAGAPAWLAPTRGAQTGPCDPELPAPDGIVLGCGTLTSHVDDSRQSPELDLRTVRLSTPATPVDAAPLVVVTGPEQTLPQAVAGLAGAARELLDSHPLVVLEHRGRVIGDHCLDPPGRQAVADIARDGADPTSPEVRGALSDAAEACTDQLAGVELAGSSRAAARDLEELRAGWDVPGLAVLGRGAGARTALGFATEHPEHTSSLLLDSPAPWEGEQESATRTAVGGSEAALRRWAAACSRPECGPGDASSRYDAVAEAIRRARAPRSPVPAAVLSDLVRGALADISGASEPAASDGDRLLAAVVSDPRRPGEDVMRRARSLERDSLPYTTGCSDAPTRVPVDRVGELSREFSGSSPAFGAVLGAQLSLCSTWPTPEAAPVALPARAPVLLLAGSADPVAGAAPVDSLAGALTSAGARDVRTVTWNAPGSRVLGHSVCAGRAAARFLAGPAAAEPSSVCPS